MKNFNINWDIDDMLGAVGLTRKTEAAGFGTFLFGLGCGLLGGCAAAILLTPYTGPETREKLLKAGEDLGRTVTSKVEELKGTVKSEVASKLPSSGIGNSTSSRMGAY